MKFLKIFFVCAFATTLAGSAWSQSTNPGSAPGIFGYVNPATNTFRPLYVQPAASSAAVSVATGKFVVNFTISVKSSIATTTPIFCSVSETFDDFNALGGLSNVVSEQASILATRTGSTAATCTVSFAYSWSLASRASDKVTLIYSISASAPTPTTANLSNRISSQYIATIPIPANGATTTETVNATI